MAKALNTTTTTTSIAKQHKHKAHGDVTLHPRAADGVVFKRHSPTERALAPRCHTRAAHNHSSAQLMLSASLSADESECNTSGVP